MVIAHNTIYSWEIELVNGEIYKQYNDIGEEQTWKNLPLDQIVRVSFIPQIALLPQHDVFISLENNERFIRRFGRGFIKQGSDGFELKLYLNCVVTNKYRFYVFSNGRTLVTNKDQEVYL
jgi:hypothetical protein